MDATQNYNLILRGLPKVLEALEDRGYHLIATHDYVPDSEVQSFRVYVVFMKSTQQTPTLILQVNRDGSYQLFTLVYGIAVQIDQYASPPTLKETIVASALELINSALAEKNYRFLSEHPGDKYTQVESFRLYTSGVKVGRFRIR